MERCHARRLDEPTGIRPLRRIQNVSGPFRVVTGCAHLPPGTGADAL